MMGIAGDVLPPGAVALWRIDPATGLMTEYIGLSITELYDFIGAEWQPVFFTDPETLTVFADFAALWSAVNAVKSFNAAHVMGVENKIVVAYQEGTDGAILDRAYRYLKMIYDTQMILPLDIWGVVGMQTRIGVNNLLRNFLADPTISIIGSSPGALSDTAWTDTPADVSDDGNIVSFLGLTQTVQCAYRVAPSITNGGLSVLVIGDSTVFSGDIVSLVMEKSVADGTPYLRFLGTKGTAPNLHEGISGTTITWFYSNVASPFYSSSGFAAGYATYCDTNGMPDAVIIKLDINGLWLQADDASANALITSMLNEYDSVVAGILAKNPETYIGLDLVNGPKSDEAIKADYGATYSAYRVRRNFQLMNSAKIAHDFGSQVDLLGGGLAISIPDGFANSLHPDASGYQEIANAYYAWLKNKVNSSVNTFLGWHDSVYNAAIRSSSKTYGEQTGDKILEIYAAGQFNGIGLRHYIASKTTYHLTYRYKPEGTANIVYLGILLWNGNNAVTYRVPAAMFPSFLGNLSYKTATYAIDEWNEYSGDIDLSLAPDFDSVTLHLNCTSTSGAGFYDVMLIDAKGCTIS